MLQNINQFKKGNDQEQSLHPTGQKTSELQLTLTVRSAFQQGVGPELFELACFVLFC